MFSNLTLHGIIDNPSNIPRDTHASSRRHNFPLPIFVALELRWKSPGLGLIQVILDTCGVVQYCTALSLTCEQLPFVKDPFIAALGLTQDGYSW
jgi:hypothetical protein